MRRSAFDEILFRHTAKLGAQTLEGTHVRQIDFDAQGANVAAQCQDGTQRRWRARFVVDARGRDTVLANKCKAKLRNEKHNSTALFGHFRGARRLPGSREGNISICRFEHGWFWFIPWPTGRPAWARCVGPAT